MLVTSVHIVPVPEAVVRSGRLRAHASIILDKVFVVKGLKVIDGDRGLFVQMPDRPEFAPCPSCGGRADIQARFCPRCGVELPIPADRPGPTRLDVAHPIRKDLRHHIEAEVVGAYRAEMARLATEGVAP